MNPQTRSSARRCLGPALVGLLLIGTLVPGRVAAQTVFVSDDGTNSIVQIGPTGSSTTYSTGTGVFVPEGLAFDSSGTLYVANGSNSSIVQIAPGGGSATTLASVSGANGLAVDGSGNVFVTDNSENVFEVTPGGTVTTFATGFSDVLGLAFDSSGYLYVADGGTNTLYKISPIGAVGTFANSASGLSGFLDGVTIGFGGNIYVSDITGGHIFQVTPGGTVTTFASGLSHARGLSFDPTANLLFVTTGSSAFGGASLSEITSAGAVSFLTGGLTDANYTTVMPVMAIPEPGTYALLLLGGIQLAVWAVRSRRGRR